MNTLRLRISTRALRVNDRDWLETCVRWLWITLFSVSFCLSFYGPATVDAAAPAVDIEVINEGNRSILAPQEWAEVLGKVCATCWHEWTQAEVMVINELRLNFMDPKSLEILERHMREFLLLDSSTQVE